ncbi:MAG: xylulokinase [Sulfitobacter sp.]|nr:xylulokinase [Sulfitobacter sp.]
MYLGIDLGTSAVKTCIIAPEGTVVATTERAYPLQHPFEGASEQSCEDWWQATCAAIGAHDPAMRRLIRGIGLSGQMHGAVLLDHHNRPLRPAILWNDSRAEAECTQLLSDEPSVGEITGVWPMAGFTAPKILWLSRHEPRIHARIAHILLPKDFIGLQLHGERVTDPSDAAGTSWFDQRTGSWSQRMCEISATSPEWLPQIRFGTEIAGYLLPEVAELLGLDAGLPVSTGAGDAAAGAVGIGAVEQGDGFISLGTSGQLFVTQDQYRPNVESRIHAYAHTHAGYWFNMAAMLNGARPMAWLAELLDRPIVDLLEEAAASDPDNLLFLPYLSGERTPHGDTTLRAGFYGLSETTSHGSLMRAVTEAIAFSFADAAGALEQAGTSVETLLAIGGGTRSDLLMQTIADILNCQIGRSDGSDIGPALGAARLAQIASEACPMKEVARKPITRAWFEPQVSAMPRLSRKLAAYRAFYLGVREARSLLE